MSIVAAENSAGYFCFAFAGRTDSAAVIGIVRILFESSSVDSRSGLEGPSKLSTSRMNAALTLTSDNLLLSIAIGGLIAQC